MALKDWKKTTTKNKITYKKNNSEIIVGKTYEGFWIVIINGDFKESFTNKSTAISFAKVYMVSN